MNNFKFFKGIHRSPSNELESRFLINLLETEILNNDRLFFISIEKEELEYITFTLDDINGGEYFCRIYEDQSFDISQTTFNEYDELENIQLLDFPNHVLMNYENLFNYLNQLPPTINDYFQRIGQ